jgi:hypothetical protein
VNVSLPQIGLHGAAAKGSASHTANHGKFADVLAESQGATETNALAPGSTKTEDIRAFESCGIKGLAGRRGEKGDTSSAERPGTSSIRQESADHVRAALIGGPNTFTLPVLPAEVIQPKAIASSLHIEPSDEKNLGKPVGKSTSEPTGHINPTHINPIFQSDTLSNDSALGWAAHLAGPSAQVPTSPKHAKGTVSQVVEDEKSTDRMAKFSAKPDLKAEEDNFKQLTAERLESKASAATENSGEATHLSRSALHHASAAAEDTNRTPSKGAQPRGTASNITSRAVTAVGSALDGREIQRMAHQPVPAMERFAEIFGARGPQFQVEGHKKSGETNTTGSSPHGKSTFTVNPTAAARDTSGASVQSTITPTASTSASSTNFAHPAVTTQEGTSDLAHEVSRPLPPGHEQSMAHAAANRDAVGEVTTPVMGSALHTARLVERMGQSEFRVGIHAGEFGNVAIRTSLGRNQFTAEISVERGELGRVLAAELPSLHTRLSEHHLPEANVILQHPSSGGSGDSRQSSQQNQDMRFASASDKIERSEIQVAMLAGEAGEASSRLDIHL